MAVAINQRTPVTVLTGFLGSGKTTLLNRILTEQHGKRIAVIENEFGEIGIDQELVIRSDEEIFEMNNGCICCTVRGDLIRILGNLMKRKDKFDYILVETTGMADPGPVAQTFFVDDDMQRSVVLDGIITLVDAKHISLHLDESAEAQEQVAFADVILLNKIDLVTAAELDALEQRIHSINSAATIYRTKDALVEMDTILNVGGFNLDRAMEVDPQFLEPEYPFEWGGIYQFAAGTYTIAMQPGPDPTMDAVILPVADVSAAALEDAQLKAVLLFSDEAQPVPSGSTLVPGERLLQLALSDDRPQFTLTIATAGAYALWTQHHPDEFSTQISGADGVATPQVEREYKPDHEHDEAVTSVGITTPGDLDPDRLNAWLGTLLRTQGQDIFRMKGVLSIKGEPERFVFQGVHMLFDGRPAQAWGTDVRRNSLIFIGRNLNRAALNASFNACLA